MYSPKQSSVVVITHLRLWFCLSVCPHDKTKRLKLKSPNLAHGWSIAIPCPPINIRSKGQGHRVTKFITSWWCSRAAPSRYGCVITQRDGPAVTTLLSHHLIEGDWVASVSMHLCWVPYSSLLCLISAYRWHLTLRVTSCQLITSTYLTRYWKSRETLS